MGHPDEGSIRALLDGEAEGQREELQAHLEECTRCGAAASTQEADLQALEEALSLLDVDPPLEAARARILRRAERNRPSPGRWIRSSLPRAASFVILITAGAAAALPGSPIRQWLATGWDSLTGQSEATPAGAPAASGQASEGAAESGSNLVGATLPVDLGGMEIRIQGLGSEASLTVRLVEGERAGIYSGQGTRFHTEEGELQAYDPPGDVTLEIPSGAQPVNVVVDGVVFLRKTDRGLEILGPVRSQTPTEIRFGPPGSSSGLVGRPESPRGG